MAIDLFIFVTVTFMTTLRDDTDWTAVLQAAQALIQQYPAAQARMQALVDSVDY